MKATYGLLGVFAIALALAGCANLSTIGRSHEPLSNTAIHLDAPQRLVIANEKGWVCAEPSPDALQAYASSFGLGFSAPSKESGSFAQALSASAGSIGLRTQSITLMRDALYRICELYYNGGLTKENAVQLLERSQDLSLGILAIEQLTGAVVAQQVNINTNSAATAAASINDTQKELDKAKVDEVTKKTALDSAQTALDAQKKIVADKTTETTTAKTNAKGTQDAIDKLSENLTDAQKALESAINDRVSSKLQVVKFETQVTIWDDRAKGLIQQVDTLHGGTVAAEKAYQDAVKANKDPTKLADLDAKRKAADVAEKEVKTQLTQAQGKLTEAKDELDIAKLSAEKANPLVDEAQDQEDQITAQIKAAREDPNQVIADNAIVALKTATDDQKKKQDALDEAKKALERAQVNTKEIEKLGNAATTAANASGSGSGAFSTITNRYGVSKDTVETLAKATTDIVQSVLYKGHLTDSCAVLLMSYANNPQTMTEPMKQIIPICHEVITAAVVAYRSKNVSSKDAGGPPSQPQPLRQRPGDDFNR